jgi:hypothetical protein
MIDYNTGELREMEDLWITGVVPLNVLGRAMIFPERSGRTLARREAGGSSALPGFWFSVGLSTIYP